MNELELREEDYDYIIKKTDVWLVYTKKGKCWVCEIGGVKQENDKYILTLATKGKSDK